MTSSSPHGSTSNPLQGGGRCSIRGSVEGSVESSVKGSVCHSVTCDMDVCYECWGRAAQGRVG